MDVTVQISTVCTDISGCYSANFRCLYGCMWMFLMWMLLVDVFYVDGACGCPCAGQIYNAVSYADKGRFYFVLILDILRHCDVGL